MRLCVPRTEAEQCGSCLPGHRQPLPRPTERQPGAWRTALLTGAPCTAPGSQDTRAPAGLALTAGPAPLGLAPRTGTFPLRGAQ